MPTEITKYLCEKCGSEFNKKLSAESCEKTHANVLSLEDKWYHVREIEPFCLVIKLTNNEVVKYYRRDKGMKHQ